MLFIFMPIEKDMRLADTVTRPACTKLDRARIDARLSGSTGLPSLRNHHSALRELMDADERSTSEIAEIIRRDPSLTTRLLHMVNAINYGTSKRPTNLDEAVFYVGVRQIRQLAMMTQIVEDLQQIAQETPFPWREFWRHSIATALMTREVTNLIQSQSDDIDYVAGLVHDIGRIVMATTFPDYFVEIYQSRVGHRGDLLHLEREVLGVDHAELGAIYLRKQKLPEVYVEIVQFHHAPQLSRYHSKITAAVQISDLLVRHSKIGESGNSAEVPDNSWFESTGWKILFGEQTEAERSFTMNSLNLGLEGIPPVLEGLV
jgi:putative nucleotidyltransferase with HDIG domain